MEAIYVEVLQPFGVRVRGLRIEDFDSAGVLEFKLLLARHGFVVLPTQQTNDKAFVAFLKRFGELTFTRGETAVEGFPDLNVVSNVGRETAPRSSFHVDTSYVRTPPAYTALRAVRVPDRGGETLFSNQYRAFRTLPPKIRNRLSGRTITHVATGVELGPSDEKTAEHPIFRPHPITGETAVYVTTPARCAAISGMGAADGKQMIRFLFEHCTQKENITWHSWAPRDVVIWDNLCVLHRADHAGVLGDRVMHRGIVGSR